MNRADGIDCYQKALRQGQRDYREKMNACLLYTSFGARMQDLTATVTYDQGQLYIYSITLLYCFFWGFAAIAWFKVLFPPISACIEKLPPRGGRVLTWALCILSLIHI